MMLVLEVSLVFILHDDFSVFVLKNGTFLDITPCHFVWLPLIQKDLLPLSSERLIEGIGNSVTVGNT